MSFFKYFKEKQDSDGEPLWWPGGPEGFPFRGRQPPQTTRKEFDNLKLSGKARCKLFHLNDEKELREYIAVKDRCANGLYALIDRDRVWDDKLQHYRVFLEWIELSYETPPPESIDAVHELTKNTDATTVPAYQRLAGVNEGW